MTTRTIALTEHLSKLGLTLDGDFMRPALELLAQELIELEAAQKIGAGKYERAAARTTHRNGYRERGLDTRNGRARNPGLFPGRERRAGLLEGVSAQSGGARPARRAVGH